MDSKNRVEAFRALMQRLCGVYGVEPTDAMIDGYWMALDDIPTEKLAAAFRNAIGRCQHMPRPVELRALTGERSAGDRALLAWTSVAKALREHGTYASIDFDDPLVNAAVRGLGGWERLGELEGDDFHVWARREFERHYAALAASGASQEACAHLPGREERVNSIHGDDPRSLPVRVVKVLVGSQPMRQIGDGK